jgi:hypothetical protein
MADPFRREPRKWAEQTASSPHLSDPPCLRPGIAHQAPQAGEPHENAPGDKQKRYIDGNRLARRQYADHAPRMPAAGGRCPPERPCRTSRWTIGSYARISTPRAPTRRGGRVAAGQNCRVPTVLDVLFLSVRCEHPPSGSRGTSQRAMVPRVTIASALRWTGTCGTAKADAQMVSPSVPTPTPG